MKSLLTLASLLVLSSSLYASEKAPEFYAAHFEVESVKATCPVRLPHGAVCTGLGSTVQLKATLGCADTLLFNQIETTGDSNIGVDLHVVSVVKKHPDSDRIRCNRANIVRITTIIRSNTTNVSVYNLGAEVAY